MLQGADSEIPQPGLEGGREIWGVYIAGDVGHVWTKEDLGNLGRAGVRAVLPIVVPAQSPTPDVGWWWAEDEGAAAIVLLVAQARAWGLPGGAPLVFDFEESTVEAMLAVSPGLPALVEARVFAACAAYGYHGWTYGGKAWHDAIPEHKGHRWLAHWSAASGEEGPVPTSLEGYGAIQYAGNVQGGRVDLDVFAGGLEYLGCDNVPAIFGAPDDPPKDETASAGTPASDGSAPESAPAPSPSPKPDDSSESSMTSTAPSPSTDPTEAADQTEAEKVADAVIAEGHEAETDAEAPVTPTHADELRTLAAAMTTHAAELTDLADRLESPK